MNESKGEAMNEKINELLSVLDMGEDRQRDWVSSNVPLQYSSYPLADLAFRMRDEVFDKGLGNEWHESVEQVIDYRYGERLKPIHWIIAALIAKVLGDKE